MMRTLLLAFGTLPIAATLFGAVQPPALKRFVFTEPHMGTTFRIVLYAPDEATAQTAAKAAFARAAELDSILSDYWPASELMQLCKKAGGPPIKVSPALLDVLQKSEAVSKISAGAFDATIGPVARMWRRARRTLELPVPKELDKALALVGYQKLVINANDGTVQLLVAGMLLDLGGIAKGYAAEVMLAILRRHGIRHVLVAAGGDIVVGEAPPGERGWKVGIAPLEDPNAKPTRFLQLANGAVSTSGDAEQYVEIGGKRYSHIVDPKTGLGLTVRSSVTVIAKHGWQADALATAACVLGPKRGLELIESFDDAAALFVVAADNGQVTRASKRFHQYEYP